MVEAIDTDSDSLYYKRVKRKTTGAKSMTVTKENTMNEIKAHVLNTLNIPIEKVRYLGKLTMKDTWLTAIAVHEAPEVKPETTTEKTETDSVKEVTETLEDVRAEVLAMGIPENLVVNPGSTGSLQHWKLARSMAKKLHSTEIVDINPVKEIDIKETVTIDGRIEPLTVMILPAYSTRVFKTLNGQLLMDLYAIAVIFRITDHRLYSYISSKFAPVHLTNSGYKIFTQCAILEAVARFKPALYAQVEDNLEGFISQA